MKRKVSTTLDPRMAWELRRQLTKASLFLWDCYGKEFLKFMEEERAARRRKSLEEDLDLETPY